ncbi:MAG: hypothetical protein K8T25_15160 [Planctomycetia bacterium]|nr:hypothetical protein [Planctomycetia bacterium]
MQRLVCLIALFLAAAAFTGCGSSDGTGAKPAASISGGPAASADANSAPGTQANEPPIDLKNITPQDLITRYLTAVKAGDEQMVSSLLTETARRRTSEANIAVAPPGSDTAEFSVGDMQVLPNDPKTAHVASMWTDKDDQGKEQTLRIVRSRRMARGRHGHPAVEGPAAVGARLRES